MLFRETLILRILIMHLNRVSRGEANNMECRRRLHGEVELKIRFESAFSLPNRNQYLVAQVMNFCANFFFCFSSFFPPDEHLISHCSLPIWRNYLHGLLDDCNCIVIASTFTRWCSSSAEKKGKKSYDNVIRFSTKCHDKLKTKQAKKLNRHKMFQRIITHLTY